MPIGAGPGTGDNVRGYLPNYELHTPASLDEALKMLAEDPSWRPLAGGTDVMVLLAAGTLPPGKLLNIWELDELRGIEAGDDYLTLGALTTYTEVQKSGRLRAEYPMLPLAASESGAVAIQNRGTLGGNIMNASPAADSPPALLAYDAELELVSTRGRRWIPYDGFHTGYKQMAIEPDELLARIRLPRQPGGFGALHYYRKVGTRGAQAISKVVMAALMRTDGKRVAHARLALGSVAPTVLRCKDTEAFILKHPLDAERVVEARDWLTSEIQPIDDIRSTARYRRMVAANLLQDCLIRLSQTSGNLPSTV